MGGPRRSRQSGGGPRRLSQASSMPRAHRYVAVSQASASRTTRRPPHYASGAGGRDATETKSVLPQLRRRAVSQ
jgi:hypothetical protein